MVDIEEDELEEWTSASEDVVVQPDSTWTHAVGVEHLSKVVTSAQEVRVKHHEEDVQQQNTNYNQCTVPYMSRVYVVASNL